VSKKKREDLEEMLERSRRVREELRQTIERVEARQLARQARYGPRDRG
jgi:hypothetical protein